MANKIPFLTIFNAYCPDAATAAQLADVLVCTASIDKNARTLDAVLECSRDLGALLSRLEEELTNAYQLSSAHLRQGGPQLQEVPVWDDAPVPPAEEEPRTWEELPPEEEDVFARTEAIRQEALKQAQKTKQDNKPRNKTIYIR